MKNFFKLFLLKRTMKKLFSISVALLMLLSGMQLTISRHYCGGELADSKVSIWGHVASCGMESAVDDCVQTGNHLESSCCNNNISFFAVDHNYTPSSSDFNSFAQDILQVFIIPASIDFHSLTAINLSSTDSSPPENLLIHAVSLPKICVFII